MKKILLVSFLILFQGIFTMNPDKQDESYLPIKKKGIDIVPDENQHSSDFFVSSEKLNERKETLFDNKKDIANIQQELRRQKNNYGFLYNGIDSSTSQEKIELLVEEKINNYIVNLSDPYACFFLKLYLRQEDLSIENENDLFIKKYRQDSFIGNNRLYVNTHNIYLLGIKGHEESLAFLRLVNYESYSENSELIKQSLIKNNKISNHEGEKNIDNFNFVALFLILLEAKNKGYEKKFFDRVVQDLIESGKRYKITLNTNTERNPESVSIYEDCGFKIASKDKAVWIEMTREL